MGQFMQQTAKDPKFAFVQTLWRPAAPQLYVDVDREKAKALGVPLNELYGALAATLGNYYVNDFNKFGRTWQVLMSAEPEYRKSPDAVGDIYVRSEKGEMIPLRSLANVKYASGPDSLARFNNLPAVKLFGAAAPGISSGQAAKSAILSVQFAELKEREGLSAAASALEAARLRFRPILMTSLAFIFGVMPLAFSTGAGAGARRSVGTGVMGGMMAATFLAIFFVPMFFKLLTDRRLRERRSTAEIKEEVERARTVTHAQVQHPHHAPHPQE